MTPNRLGALGRRIQGRLRRSASERADVKLLRGSEHFDAIAYLALHPDVATSGMDPHVHFARFGAGEGRSVGPAFDVDDYLARYPDVARSDIHPLLHCLHHGRSEGRVARAAPPVDEEGQPVTPVEMRSPQRRRVPGKLELRLASPVATLEDGRLTITCDMGAAPPLWVTIECPDDALARIQPRLEPFLPMALIMAGIARRDLVVDGPVDADFLATIRLSYLRLLEIFYGFEDIGIEVAAEQHQRTPAGGGGGVSGDAALLFSGGIDSFYSLVRLREIGYRPRFLMNLNAGAHGPFPELRRRRLDRIRRVARAQGHDLLVVDSNFHEVVQIAHQYAHPFRTIAAAISAYGAVGRVFLSTSRSYHGVHFGWKEESPESAGAVVTDSLAWARVPVTEIGYDKTRFEKTRAISDEPLSHSALDVCLNGRYMDAAGPDDALNCGTCPRCAKAMMDLEHIGRLDRYASQFDRMTFLAKREVNLDRITEQGIQSDLEDLAVLRGSHVPPSEPLELTEPPWVGRLDEGIPDSPGQEPSDRPRSQPRRPIRLYWWRHANPNVHNFGDEVSPLIVERVSGRRVEWAPPEECELMAIGSIAEIAVSTECGHPRFVWGSGFNAGGDPVGRGALQVTALRGPDSARRLGMDGGVPLGDPGLLVDLLLDGRPEKLQGLGIVPHHKDLDLPIVEAWRERSGVIISPLLPQMLFISAIARCEFVLSSSLHGLVVADALGVPNRWVDPSDRVPGGGFKFRDYLSTLGRSTDPVDLPFPDQFDEDSAQRQASDDAPSGVARIREDLARAFPLR